MSGAMHLERTAFVAHGETFSVGDVLGWGLLSRKSDPAWQRVRARLGCFALARAQALTPSAADTREGVRDWRRRRQLGAAERTREWLELHGLDLGALTAHVERCLAYERHHPLWRARSASDGISLEQIGRILPEDVCFEGELPALARVCAGCTVVPAAAGFEAQWAQLSRRLRGSVTAACLQAWGLEQARIARLASLELARRQELERLAGSPELEQELRRGRVELTQVELWAAPAAARSVVMELLATLREEPGLTLEALCARHQLPVEKRRLFLEQLPDRVLAARLAGARPGEALGPCPEGQGWEALQLVARIEPEPQDAQVRTRALERVYELLHQQSRARQVRFEGLE